MYIIKVKLRSIWTSWPCYLLYLFFHKYHFNDLNKNSALRHRKILFLFSGVAFPGFYYSHHNLMLVCYACCPEFLCPVSEMHALMQGSPIF